MNEGDYIRGYRLKREIGRGSYGDVWLAEKQMDFGGASIFYALKFLRNRNEEGIDIEKVIKEIVAWTKASSHANVISIRDCFVERGKYVIVSDYAEGGSLKTREFSFEEAVKIIEGVLEGVEYLHAIPMIHRDIKPENILLKNGVACISDFGLAREFDKTQSTGLGGSINYFSPEMAKKELDNEAHERNPLDDLWATAVTLYQLITNDLPFKRLGHIIKCRREPLPANFPKELVGFFNKAFHRNPARRFQTAKRMRDALRRAAYPEASFESKIEELTLRSDALQSKILESQNNANLLYKMVAEERIKSQQLTAAQREIEKKSVTEKENARKLQAQIDLLENDLRNARAEAENAAAENAKLKKYLRVLEKQHALPVAKPHDENGKKVLPAPLEKSFVDAGDDFLNKKQYDQAIDQFTEAIKLDSANANAYLKRGIAYNGRGAAHGSAEDYDNAIKDYYQATYLKGNGAQALQIRGAADESGARRNQWIDAAPRQSVTYFATQLKLHPIFNDARDELKKAKKKKRVGMLKHSLKWLALLLALSGLYLSTFFTITRHQAANDCYEKKDYACAVENYSAAINWSPKYWLTSENEAYHGRGNAYLMMGDVERALNDYNEAVKLNPNDAKAAKNLKFVHNFRQKKVSPR